MNLSPENSGYSERAIQAFSNQVLFDLMKQCHSDPNSYNFDGSKISISKEGIKYEAFYDDEINTVRQILIILTVVGSVYTNKELSLAQVVKVPSEALWKISPNNKVMDHDLF
jgi:hypothetical protein